MGTIKKIEDESLDKKLLEMEAKEALLLEKKKSTADKSVKLIEAIIALTDKYIGLLPEKRRKDEEGKEMICYEFLFGRTGSDGYDASVLKGLDKDPEMYGIRIRYQGSRCSGFYFKKGEVKPLEMEKIEEPAKYMKTIDEIKQELETRIIRLLDDKIKKLEEIDRAMEGKDRQYKEKKEI